MPRIMMCTHHLGVYQNSAGSIHSIFSNHVGRGLFYVPEEAALQWRHNGRDSVSNHLPHDCLHNRLFRRRSKKTSKHRITGICAANSPGTGEIPAQMASCVENVSIWWRHHGISRNQSNHSIAYAVTRIDLASSFIKNIIWILVVQSIHSILKKVTFYNRTIIRDNVAKLHAKNNVTIPVLWDDGRLLQCGKFHLLSTI